MLKGKGKGIAGKTPAGKRKRGGGGDDDKTGKKRNREVLQFFEDAASEDSDSSFDLGDDFDFMEEEFGTESKIDKEPGKDPSLPVFPKEEEMNEEEFDKLMEERYKDGSNFVRYAEDDFENKRAIDRNNLVPSAKDPTIWKVKCMVGRERNSAFCLMQKFVDLKSLGTKLQIISAFALDHIKGCIYIEADKQCDINEACKGLSTVYSSRITIVPKNEVSHLLSSRSARNEVSEGTWARVKNGKYKGDLAQIVAVNDARKRATVKLIPRIDLQAMTAKFGGGVSLKKNSTPAPRLISTSELEELRPLIQYRRDRDTNKVFEVLDGQMLKDGYLYKKVSIDSLSCAGVVPSEEELLKFKSSEKNEADDLEWLSQLYGDRKKKRTIRIDKGGGKGEGSSGSSGVNSFELYDLACFGRKDFGVIIGIEKDDSYKILKEGSEGPVVVTVQLKELKSGPFDMKFTALDQHMKPISACDTIRVLEGPSKGRQGIVRQIYRGTIFLFDENESENGGYFCAKSQMCEKVKLSTDVCKEKVEKGGESGLWGFEDPTSSPKSPLSPKKPWQAARENGREFNRGDKDEMFSIGQTLRIRIGPLKGYLCRVLAIRHSDVTVKLDSQHKVLTVKSEHLTEVRGKSSTMSMSEDPESSSLKPFALLGTEGSTDWMDGAGTSAGSDRWNSGGLSAGRSSWPSFPASGISLQPESSSANPFSSEGNDKKDVENAAWESKVAPSQSAPWGVGTGAANENSSRGAAAVDENSSWGTAAANKNSSWGAAAGNEKSSWGAASEKSSWGKAITPDGDLGSSSKVAGDNWGKGNLKVGTPTVSSNDAAATWEKKTVSDDQDDWRKSEEPWNKGKSVGANPTSWGNATSGNNQPDSWGKGKDIVEAGSWEKKKSAGVDGDGLKDGGSGWNQQKAWDKGKDIVASEGSTWGKSVENKTDLKSLTAAAENEPGDWDKSGGSWAQGKVEKTDEARWNKAKFAGGSQTANWGNVKKTSEDATGWSKARSGIQDQTNGSKKPEAFGDNGRSWNKNEGSSWTKPAGGSPWSKQADANVEDGSKGRRDQDNSWNRSKSFGGDQGPSDWKKGWGENKEGADQQDSWERPKAFGEDRGFGGRRGRGDGRGRGDQFGRGRSSSQGEGGWNRGRENNSTNDGISTGNPSGWNYDQTGGWAKSNASDWGKKDDGWQKANASDDNNGSGSNKGWGVDKEIGESGDQWNKSKPPRGDWSAPKASNDDKSFGWNNKSAANEGAGRTGDDGGGWNKKKGPDENRNTGWTTKANDVDGNQSSGWGKKTTGNNEEGEHKNQGGGWNSRTSDQGSATGWSQSGSNVGENQDSNWRKKSTWNSGSSDANRNQDSSWGKKSDGNGGGNQSSNWGKSNWNSGSGDANQDSSWGKKSSWNSGSAFGGNQSVTDASEDQTEFFGNRASGGNSRGGFGGRGRDRSDRGGFRGRGGFGGRGGDRGGFGGRGGDRGGFGGRGGDGGDFGDRGGDGGGLNGRGRSDRGGFGGRGRGRRDQSGGWNNRNDSSEDRPSDWSKGAGEGWKNSDYAGTWNNGSDDKNKWQGWNAGSGGTSNQTSSWNSQLSGGNQPTEVKDVAGGWNKGTGSTNEAGGSKEASSQSSGWNSQGSGWNQPKETKDVAGGWNKGTGSTNEAGGSKGTSSQSSGWNSQGSGWKQPSEAKDVAGGWNKGTSSTNEAGGSKGNNWGSTDASGGSKPDSWGKSTSATEVKESNDQGGGWNGGPKSSTQSGGWNR